MGNKLKLFLYLISPYFPSVRLLDGDLFLTFTVDFIEELTESVFDFLHKLFLLRVICRVDYLREFEIS